MKSWTKDIVIHAPIEDVWAFFDGSLENMQKIMPQVVDNTPITITEEKIGSIYRQTYKEGKRTEEYDVETLEFLDSPDRKRLKVGFTLSNMFDITADYELEKLSEQETAFTYTATNRPLKWFVKLFLLFANDKVVVQFLERVKMEAEKNVH